MTAGTQRSLQTIVQASAPFTRSANIAADVKDPSRLPDYSFSERSVEFLKGWLDSVDGLATDRAWSVIGPYGSGKSLFGVFLLGLADARAESDWLGRALAGLRMVAPDLAERASRMRDRGDLDFVPVPVLGARTSFGRALAHSLADACRDSDGNPRDWVSGSFLAKVDRQCETLAAGMEDAAGTAQLFQQAAQQAASSGKRGLLLIVDEFGQFLEHATSTANSGNLIAAQYLAELANRSGDNQLQFITLLHQGITHYAATLPEDQQTEWLKVQGRFREIPFSESPENQYHLIRSALVPAERADDMQGPRSDWAKRVWRQVESLPAFQGGATADYWQGMLEEFCPLHPLTVYALPRLASLIGQNERTLFTFLSSQDPWSFQSFLRDTYWAGDSLPSLTLDRLYDFFLRGTNPVTLPADARRRISEAEAALDRLGDRPPIQEAAIKALAVLAILQRGAKLKPTEDALAAGLDVSDSQRAAFEEALGNLVERKLIVFRRYAGEYALWQGTDFDFETAFAKAHEAEKAESGWNLDVLNEDLRPRPVVARRHSFESGTVRAFEWQFATVPWLKQHNENPLQEISAPKNDGVLLQVLPTTWEELRWAADWAAESNDPCVVTVIPPEPTQIPRWATDLAALDRIYALFPEVNEDNVALRELRARREHLEDQVREGLEHLEEAEGQTEWFWLGRKMSVGSRAVANSALSEICEKLYGKAPVLKNELINRDHLSSSVVVAAKQVIEALLENPRAPRLGFDGNGPEVSIARSMLEDSRLYRRGKKGYGLYDPPNDDPCKVKPLWSFLKKRAQGFKRTDNPEDSPFPPLIRELSQAPYGLRRGPAWVYIWVFMIRHRDNIALYDNGSFVADWSVELFDRFTKHPESFSATWFTRTKQTRETLAALAECVPTGEYHRGQGQEITVPQFLRSLYRWFRRLPDYTKRTTNLSEPAVALRRVLFSAVDPIDLLTERMPEALSVEAHDQRRKAHAGTATVTLDLVEPFRQAVRELDMAYSALVNRLVARFAEQLGWGATVQELRQSFASLEPRIVERIADPQLRAFFVRGRAETLADLEWLESIAAALVGQSPRSWADPHEEEFGEQLAAAVKALRDAQRRSFAAGTDGAEGWLRVVVESPQQVLADELVTSEVNGEVDEWAEQVSGVVQRLTMGDSGKRRLLLSRLLAKEAQSACLSPMEGGGTE